MNAGCFRRFVQNPQASRTRAGVNPESSAASGRAASFFVMSKTTLPSFQLITNDDAALLHRDARLPENALRYTCPGLRGLLGGVWRSGRTYEVEGLGLCFGPEIFYLFGADDAETRDAFDLPREVVMASEAASARAAHAFVSPIARSLQGEAHLGLVQQEGDRHLLQIFVPMSVAMERFRPHEWFAFWKERDAEFRAAVRAGPAEKTTRAA